MFDKYSQGGDLWLIVLRSFKLAKAIGRMPADRWANWLYLTAPFTYPTKKKPGFFNCPVSLIALPKISLD